jgi:CheY-like chemotaxis protein
MARILLVDDDKTTRELVSRALLSDGHTLETMDDGSDALAAFLKAPESFDLIVSDVQMPGTDGITFAEQALQASPRIRIVLMSGLNEALTRGRNLSAARVQVLAKPFALDQMRRVIKDALSA